MAGRFLNRTSPASCGTQLTATLGGSPRGQRLFRVATYKILLETILAHLSPFNFHLVLRRMKPFFIPSLFLPNMPLHSCRVWFTLTLAYDPVASSVQTRMGRSPLFPKLHFTLLEERYIITFEYQISKRLYWLSNYE